MKRAMIFLFRFLLATLVLTAPAGVIRAESEGILNKLLAPGPLIEGHKQLEGADCLKCHASGQGVPNDKCLDCHKEIRRNVEAKRAYHGRLNQQCIKCHRDHKGRDFDPIAFDTKQFDHKLTGYALEGKHEKIKCEECHQQKRGENSARPGEVRYYGQASSCVSCHAKNDVHYFKGDWAKKDCGVCHGVKTWKEDLKFNHRRDTGYDLVGKHADTKCADCHKVDKKTKTAQYRWQNLKASQCLTCHDDFHKSNISAKYRTGDCTKCHNQDEWKIKLFNHEVTGFKLNGKHKAIDCTKCHTQSTAVLQAAAATEKKNYAWHGLAGKTKCLSCHDDYHLFANYKSKSLPTPQKCETCHNESDWHQIHDFDHDRNAHYKIDGKHLDVTCSECHIVGARKNMSELDKTLPQTKPGLRKAPKYHWPELLNKTCETCHKSPHVGEFSTKMLAAKCTECHVTDGWKVDRKNKNFAHDRTRFSLTGKHTRLSCNECHLIDNKQVFRFKSFDKDFCVDCHRNQHIGQFNDKFSSQACSACHSTERFDKLLPFDHDLTRFKLRDAHAKVNCNECHIATSDKFELKVSAKLEVKPEAQISRVKHKFMFSELQTKACLTCHTDYHSGQLGNDCAKCHSEKTWKQPKFDHNSQSKFALKDKHQAVKCEECHRPVKGQYVKFADKQYPVIRYKPVASACVDCHTDYHVGQLGRDCSQCHLEKGWKATKFDHEIDSVFPLKGKHKEAKCEDCHKPIRGQVVRFKDKSYPVVRYAPISTACTECHKDAHNGALGIRCADCHNENGWRKINDFHKNFTLRGVHYTISCTECHMDNRHLGGTSEQCILCHQKDDVHHGSLPNCGECHLQQFWEHSKFRHSMTFFPLRGVHRTLDCAQCHRSGVYRGLSSRCIDCHAARAAGVTNPPHTMPAFSQCSSCHNQFSFEQ